MSKGREPPERGVRNRKRAGKETAVETRGSHGPPWAEKRRAKEPN